MNDHTLIHILVQYNPKAAFILSWVMVGASFVANVTGLSDGLLKGLQITAACFAIWTSIEVRKYYREKRKQLNNKN